MVSQALDTGAIVISNLFVSPALNVPVVGVSVPLVRHGIVRYVLGARLDVAALGRVLSEGKLPEEWIGTIIDREGTIVARTRGIEEFLGHSAAPELVAQSRLSEEGSLGAMSVDGIAMQTVFSRSRLSGWSVTLGIPDALVEAPGRRSLWAMIGGGLVFLLIAGVSATTVGRRIARGIASLSASAQVLGEGKMPAGAGGSGITEVEDVEREMIESARGRADAVTARLNSEEALRESEHRTRLIVSHALDAVITFDAEGHITSWNPQAESLFGWREDEAVGLLLTETVIPPVHREAVRRGLARLAAGDEGRLLGRRIELTGLRRDGTELPIELAITPMPIGGKIVFSAFLRDITERKQSEERTAELARLARALTESLDMDTVTDRVVTSVVAVFKARAAFISLVEPDGFLRCVALAGNPLNEFQRAYRSAPGVGMAGRAVAERRPVWTSDVLSEPGLEYQDEFRRAVASANNRSVLVVPLRIKEDVIGVLAFTDDKVRTFSDDEIGRLQTFADHAALAIRNVQLFSTEQAARAKAATLAERLEVLHETDQAVISGEAPDAIAAKAVLRLRNLLGVPRAIVNLFDLAAGEVQWLAAAGRRRVHRGPGVRFPLSMMGDVEALRRGELQVVDVASLAPSGSTEALLASGISTYMVVPMIANGELLGGLSFGGEPGEYSAEQVSIAREVAAQLAIAVQQARLHERVKRHAEELTQRVQERTLELTDANEQLKRESADRERAEAVADRANRAKSEFLSRMSHELRTPLNGIIGFGQLLQLDALEPEQSESVEHILKGGRHLLTLINEVLDITRIEADTLSVSLEPVSSDEALRTALSLVRPQAAVRMVTLREVASCDCFVMADRQRLHQVLLNLLSNAIKYNREGGSVEVSCTKTVEGRVRLAVSDTGHGISPAMLARLYTPFDRLGADERGIEGTGLGLALSKRLVEAMNGSLVVESRRGVGTTFTAELAGAEAPWAVSVGPEDVAADTGTPRARGTVLYIEDNLANLRLVERIIARRPELTLISAMMGGQGLELARSHRPQAIILDLHLPDMFGGEVLARLREDSRTQRDPRRDPQRRCDARADHAASRSGRSRLPDQAARRRTAPRVPRQPLCGTVKPCRTK